MPTRRTQSLVAIASLALFATTARADEWLTARHDPQRTGASSGSLLVDRPAIAWRRYLGGQLTSSQYFALDVDRDGNREVVYIAGGRVIAKRPDNVIAWESPLLTLSTVAGIADLDMDGNVEVIAYSSNRVYALSSSDGHVLWSNPPGPIAEVGAVRVADLDGDRRPDLYIGECRCCTLRGTANGVAYGFAAGFAAAQQMWTLGTDIGGCGADQDQIADVNGDGTNEIIVSSRDPEIEVVNAATGTAIARIPAPTTGSYFPNTRVFPVNLDADAALEFVAVTNGYQAVGDRGARRVVVYDSVGGSFSALWQADAPDRVNDSLDTVEGAIGDLGGTPAPEIAIGLTVAGAPRVEVRNALTGAVLATLPGATLTGAVDLDNDHIPELLVTEGTALAAYRFDGTATLARRWSLPARTAARTLDHGTWLADANPSRVLALDLDSDPALELIVRGRDASGRATLWALNADVDPPTEIGHFSAPDGITILTTAIGDHVTQPNQQVVVVTSDGYLIVLDRTMAPTNRIAEGEIQLPGMRVGGYYSGPYGIGPTPSIARLGASAILARDSRPSLLRLDASSAGPSAAPTVVWERSGAAWPVVADLNGDGTRDLVVAEGTNVVALDAATARTELWRANGVADPQLLGDLLPARRGATGVDIYLPRLLTGATFGAVALNGATGAVRWNGFTRPLQWGFQSYSVGDLDGDAIDDFVSITNSTHVLNGADGSLRADNNTFVAYAMPMLTDADGDGVTDVWVHGGYFADRLIGRDMTDRVIRSDRTAPNTGRYGARVTCNGEAAVVESGYDSSDLWTIRLRDAMPIAHRTLASGDVFDAGMAPSDRATGLVGNVTAVRDIGTAHPAVLAGSTDGYLYALDPCALTRIWSLELRYPVGEPVVGDVNGTDPDELVVTCADGFLYGIGRAAYDAPMTVSDTDPSAADPSADVDAIDTVDTLYASWTPVAGATSYEVGVFSAGGSETRFPNVTNVGGVTVATISMLPLQQGAGYYVTVRPIGPNGPGLEARSDGVVVGDAMGPTATVTVTPMRAWPAANNPPTIGAVCADRVGLSHYSVEVRRADGSVVRVLDDVDYTGASRTVNIAWDGNDAAGAAQPAGDYSAHVVCRDLRMREASADAAFALDPSAVVRSDAGVDGARDGAGGDGGMNGGGAGCACRAGRGSAGRGSAGGAAWWVVLVVLAFAGNRGNTRQLKLRATDPKPHLREARRGAVKDP